jgi:hypothetical protein
MPMAAGGDQSGMDHTSEVGWHQIVNDTSVVCYKLMVTSLPQAESSS